MFAVRPSLTFGVAIKSTKLLPTPFMKLVSRYFYYSSLRVLIFLGFRTFRRQGILSRLLSVPVHMPSVPDIILVGRDRKWETGVLVK